jgi:phosphoenolpyruvate-protein phosphotransferase (PTS system enzyme I)
MSMTQRRVVLRTAELMPERSFHGRPAAPGLSAGSVFVLEASTGQRESSGDPTLEAGALQNAVAAALAELAALSDEISGDGADMLAFQIAMLEDDELMTRARVAIAGSASAQDAWRAVLDAEIAGYAEAEEEYFRARASDLRDIRDRVLASLMGESGLKPIPPGAVLIAEDLTPSRFLAADWSRGGAIALTHGSSSSHVAMLARARGVPMVVGLPADLVGANGQETALVDGAAGTVLIEPGAGALRAFAERVTAREAESAAAAVYLTKPAETSDGTPISVLANIADLAELDSLDWSTCDGIGLVRTEFLFYGAPSLPDEETQYSAYRRIAEWGRGKPVTIRTLDAGGDKPIPGLTVEGETNPFLGLRGIRLSLSRPEVFRIQLRALARAATHGAIEAMLPMITVPDELARARSLLDEEIMRLSAAGVPCRRPALGIMVEVPSAAIAITDFDADFFSIGSNDLTQYVTAAARDTGTVADLNDPTNPAVLYLIKHVVAHGRRANKKVSLCGDAGGEPDLIPAFLETGLRVLSVAPASLARTKAAIAAVALVEGQ